MKCAFLFLTILLILLTSCLVPEPKAPIKTQQAQITKTTDDILPAFDKPLPVKTVTHTTSTGKKFYGYNEKNQLVYYENEKGNWNISYKNNTLAEISKLYKVNLEHSRINGINENGNNYPVETDSQGRITKISTSPYLSFQWDSKNDLRTASRGVSGKTSLDYDDNHNVKQITRGLITTNVRYDDKSRIRVMNADDVDFVIGYWKDSKLMKITGSLARKGIEISYGPDYPPTTAEIISAEDSSTFSAPDTETLYDAVDLYLYCNYIRRLEVPFDGVSYSIFINYKKGTLLDYLSYNKLCEVIA